MNNNNANNDMKDPREDSYILIQSKYILFKLEERHNNVAFMPDAYDVSMCLVKMGSFHWSET